MQIASEVAQIDNSIEAAVLGVIRQDFYNDFMDVYGLVVATAEVHPEQANNEIRNAISHLARALEQGTGPGASEQVQKARAHSTGLSETALRSFLSVSIEKFQERFGVSNSEMACRQRVFDSVSWHWSGSESARLLTKSVGPGMRQRN